MSARGVLHVLSCPPALCPHVTWAVAREMGVRVDLTWTPQPAVPGTLRGDLEWRGRVGGASRLASALLGWRQLRFEVTELPTAGCDGVRFSHTPALGLFHATIGANGDVLVGEDRLRTVLARAATGDLDVTVALDALLGTAWDVELEPFRQASDGHPADRAVRVG